MDYATLINAVLSLGGMGLLFAILIALANKKLHVEEDPRIEIVAGLLPGANCGACGYPGCNACAEALVNGKAALTVCPACTPEAGDQIAATLGLTAERVERKVAVLMCQGGEGSVTIDADYQGIPTCIAATFISGGGRACSYGCIGLGDCVAVCPFEAIRMGEKGLPVIDRQKCTGCGRCVEACPRKILELHPISRHVFILCKNKDNAKNARAVCKHACIACKICEKAVEGQGFKVDGNLAVMDHNLYTNEPVLPTDKCPTKAIVIVGHADER